MNKILILTIMSGIMITVIVIGLLSLSKPEQLRMDEIVENFTKANEYVQKNTNHFVTEREYYVVMRMAEGDPDKAIEILNDPDYPQKFYDETGHLPDEKPREMYPEILKRLSDNYSYIKENTNHEFTRDEYSDVMRLSNGDPIKAVKILNDPDFPQKFYDETGHFPAEKRPEMFPAILEKLSDNYSYIKENTNHEFTEDEYSFVMRLSNGDPIKAVKILNDPDFPQKFYDETGSLP